MIVLLADDLTGAAEIAGVCLRYGLKTAFGINEVPDAVVKALGVDGCEGGFQLYDACVVATDSRSLPAVDAARLHRNLAVAVKELKPTLLFKKTDSVLRGHVMDELMVLSEVFITGKVLLQPANPAIGRCIRNGRYEVGGRPLSETSFADDPDYPALTDEVVGLLEGRRTLGGNLPIRIATKVVDKPGIHVPDCTTVELLKTGLMVGCPTCLLAGSAAFLGACLEVCLGLSVQQVAFRLDPMRERYLLVCGSRHAQSRTFVEAAKRKGAAVSEFPDDFLQETINSEALNNWADSLAEFWNRTGQMIVSLSDTPVVFPNSASVLTRRLATVLGRLLGQCRVDELVVVGGATAWAILSYQRWHLITPVEELAPGVVRLHIDGTSLNLTLKPGSYLWPDDLDT